MKINLTRCLTNTYLPAVDFSQNPKTAFDANPSLQTPVRLPVHNNAQRFGDLNQNDKPLIKNSFTRFLEAGAFAYMLARTTYYRGLFSNPIENLNEAWSFVSAMGAYAASFKPVPPHNVYIMVGFQNDVREIFSNEKVTDFIRELTNMLYTHREGDAKINLWELTLKYTEGSRSEAIRWLAVLFQDSSPVGPHLNFLKYTCRNDALYEVNLYRMKKVLAKFDGAKGIMDSFPPELCGIGANSRVYHFYVIAYLAQKLQSKFGTKASAQIPMIFNTSYEYFSDFKVRDPEKKKKDLTDIWHFVRVALTDPPAYQFGSPHLQASLEDIYLGYAGALAGDGRFKDILPFGEFKKRFSENPKKFIQDEFR